MKRYFWASLQNYLHKFDKGYALVKINREGVKEYFILKINLFFQVQRILKKFLAMNIWRRI